MQSKHGDPKQNCFKNIYLVRLRVNFIDLGDKLIDIGLCIKLSIKFFFVHDWILMTR